MIWGLYHGLLLIIHRLLKPALERITPRGLVAEGFWRVVRVGFMFQLTSLGWLIFRAESVPQIGVLLRAVVGLPKLGHVLTWLAPFGLLVAPLVLFQTWQARSGKESPVLSAALPIRLAVYVVMIATLVVLGEDFGEPFIYFQF